MQEPKILSDSELDAVLSGEKPVLLLITDGEGLRGDFSAAFKKAAAEQKEIVVARIDPRHNPQAAARFDVGGKPVLVGWSEGEEVVRRTRPWGTDVPLAVEMLKATIKSQSQNGSNHVQNNNENQTPVVDDKPVVVTDETFQKEVIDYDKPVLVDFWAEWCGPCRMVSPILEKLAKEFAGQIRIAKVNVDENPGLSQTFRIMSIPNIMAIKNRTMVFNQPGALPEAAFRDLIRQLIALEVPMPDQQTDPEPETE